MPRHRLGYVHLHHSSYQDNQPFHQVLDLFSKLRFIENDWKMNSEDHTHPNITENNKEMVALLNSYSALACIPKGRLKSYCYSAEIKGKLTVLQKMLIFADTQIYCSM